MASNIFGNSSEKLQTEVKDKVDTHSKAILTVVEHQKDIESTVDLLSEKFDMLDQNSIKDFRKIFNDMKAIRTDLRDLKQEIEGIKEFNSKMTKQIKLMSTRDEVDKLEKYIDLWNPMGFVTRDELEENRKKIVGELKGIIEEFMKEE